MGDWFRGLSWRQEFDCGRSSFACFLRQAEGGERCERDGPGWRRRGLDHRTRQSTPILERVVSHVTITDPRHSLFGQRLAVIAERSGRGPGYVVIELPDGRRRSVRTSATNLAVPSQPVGADLPRISVRTLIPLARHVNRILNLLTEEVIRDEPSSPSTSSRCVSTADPVSATNPGRQDQPVSGGSSASVVGPVARDANTDRPDTGGAVASDAAYGHARKGDGPC